MGWLNYASGIVSKENLKKAGAVALKLGKAVVIEGIKGVAIKSATRTIETAFESGVEGVRRMTIDDYVGKRRPKLIEALVVEESTKTEKGEDVVYVDAEIVEKRS